MAKIDPTQIQKNIRRSMHRAVLTDDLRVAARCVVLQTAIDTFCTRCQYGEDGIMAITRRIKSCVNIECPLYPVRTGTKGTQTLSTMANLHIETKNFGKPKLVGWTQEEEMDLLERKNRKQPIKRIALETNRTRNDVIDRLDLLKRAINRNRVLVDDKTNQ